MEYIPADRAVIPLKKGEPAPTAGWFVPPAVMQEIVPCLDEKFRNSEAADKSKPTDKSEPVEPSTDNGRPE
ncbi:MAG: hypothetical protein IH899_18590 [Planctomycetes bacterium]|nr:hypothetical protein [Planctomycetota bacterium]